MPWTCGFGPPAGPAASPFRWPNSNDLRPRRCAGLGAAGVDESPGSRWRSDVSGGGGSGGAASSVRTIERPALAAEVRTMRDRVEAGHPCDLKRGAGGLVDVEFIVQLLQLRHAAGRPDLQYPNTRDALTALHQAGLLGDAEHADLRAGYDFLRSAENRLRGVTNRASDELPDEPAALAKLARRLGYDAAENFLADLAARTRQVRAAFEQVCEREGR